MCSSVQRRGRKKKDKVLRPHVHSAQQKEPSKIKGNVNFMKSEKEDEPCIVRI